VKNSLGIFSLLRSVRWDYLQQVTGGAGSRLNLRFDGLASLREVLSGNVIALGTEPDYSALVLLLRD